MSSLFMQRIERKQKVGDEIHSELNKLAAPIALLAAKIAVKAQNSGFPLHQNVPLDRMEIAVIAQEVTTKAGLAFRDGDLILVKTEKSVLDGKVSATAYSFRLGSLVSLGDARFFKL